MVKSDVEIAQEAKIIPIKEIPIKIITYNIIRFFIGSKLVKKVTSLKTLTFP